ncbi:MAG TPA: PQQ-dependent sugar dehydrogenase [Ramlibacter sp.]|jgi:glucose/arabinose dehydrogenase|uniref:PQQ-dependent sugar dehydrogenase n=1 Tax=Ramlibacter sp. TaxID=1917967 RepID=UPI002D51B59E|nr:PQQ-dependent sugar dehydrogenase [Ramlibacter sp.]HZY16839.1 PQQ-dependent sugar dehydrogenase [Ramlibacter sp.]
MFERLGLAACLAALAAGCAQTPPPPTLSAAAGPVAAGAPDWQQGRSAAMASSTLAPVAGKLTATPPSEIPLDKLKLPPGFKAELWAHGMPGIRAMSRTESGKIYAGTRGIGRVYEITDSGGQRTSRVVVDKLNQPAVTYHNGALYVVAIDKVLRYDGIDRNPGAQPVDLTAKFDLPPKQHHNWKYVRFGPDGKLYVPFGAPCNICLPEQAYAQIRRYDADGSNMEVVARGVRNTQGFDWHPVTKEMWFTDHGRDWLGDEGPEDELNRMPRVGLNYGFPYCHASGIADPDVKRDKACDGVTLPVRTMGPHAAAMGVHFYTGTMFPPEYRNVLFVARKGSWNRTRKFGYDVVAVKADAEGRDAQVTPFVTGFLDEGSNQMWGRPVYMLQLPDGSLLLSDEQVGAIYRITYARS